MGYRVDDVPTWARPQWEAGSRMAAATWGRLLEAARARVAVRVEAEVPLPSRSVVYAAWHRDVLSVFLALDHLPGRHVWMQHPAAYMRPVHLLLDDLGVAYELGSGGDEGRRAAERVAARVRDGAVTVVFVDGPRGPPGVLKKGVLHVAAAADAAVIPLRMDHDRHVRLPTWDGKRVPRPGSTLRLRLGAPLVVGPADLQQAANALKAALGAP